MFKAIFTKIIDGLTEAERRGYSILAACKDGSPDCHRAVLGYTEPRHEFTSTTVE